MITWKLEFDKSIKDNSFWKFNCSLLKDKQYVDEINTEMQNVSDEYANEHYDKSYLHGVPKSEIELKVSDRLFLDFMLMKVRSKTIAYATMKKKRTKEKENNLEHDTATLEGKKERKKDGISVLKDKSQELILIREKKMEGVLLRSKAILVSEGKKDYKGF